MGKASFMKTSGQSVRSNSLARRNYADFITLLARDNPLRVYVHEDKPKKPKRKKLGGRP